MPPARDYKRVGESDRGPNTGGMGAYCPPSFATPALVAQIRREILEPTVRALADEGRPYRGVLYAGIMVTPIGPRVLEFNCRFGDPETQVLMATLEGDLAEALAAAARGKLDPAALGASGEHAVCVVLAAEGYPDTPRKGDVIEGLEGAATLPGVNVIHAGTALDAAGRVVSAGGRVLGVTGRGATLKEAHKRAYQAVRKIGFSGMQYRRDIAGRAGLTLLSE